MSKKAARPKIVTPGFDPETGLPTPEKAQQTIQATVAPEKKSISIEDLNNRKKRTPGLTRKGRVKYTTMIKPELRRLLDDLAESKEMTAADVLEIIITEYLGLKK